MGIPAWLQDVTRAAQLLTRLSLESAAQASLLIKDGELWAYAGELPQPAAQELAGMVAGYWKTGGGKDLARFIRLEAVRGDYMLYATSLVNGMLLAVVYSVETPFSKIRSQASQLAKALASPPTADVPVDPAPPARATTSPPVHAGVREELLIPRVPVFEDVPPPDPHPHLRQEQDTPPGVDEEPLPVQVPPVRHSPEEGGWLPEAVIQEDTPDEPLPVQRAGELEPTSTTISRIYLSCVLVPRMPQYGISGRLAELLPGWFSNLCIAFGWRLEHFAAGSSYLAWVILLPPETSPAGHLETVRSRTSDLIFEEFPNLRRENPSGDFWAPGYWLTSSSQPPSPESVRKYVQQVRRHQGVPARKL